MDLNYALEREWLETNGLGGFASSTIAGMNTRRYHGLLVAATAPPVGRMVLLSRFEEVVIARGMRYELSANCYPGVVHPRGYEYLEAFEQQPFPVFRYRLGDIELRKRVFMVHGRNTTVIEYEAGAEVTIELRPLIAFRDYHALTHRNHSLDPSVIQQPGLIALEPYPGVPAMYLAHDHAQVQVGGDWYRNHQYQRELERGLDFEEDLFNPCVLRFPERRRATVVASLQPQPAAHAQAMRESELQRRRAVRLRAPVPDPLVERLVTAADQFVVERGKLRTIIAGYHWFSDWGRDTMIALPGIALVTRQFDVARDILLAFAQSLDRGMLPNRFPDAGQPPEYNTVDATLWFFEAVRAYVAYTGDRPYAAEVLYPRLMDILDWHLRGTRYGIAVDEDGLLRCGEPGLQLTWMDAKIGDWVVTPRYGKPVEIQALWYNALEISAGIAAWARDAGRELSLRQLAQKARAGFDRLFWNETTGCLYDCVGGGAPDPAVRPNQVFAVSLHHAILNGERARRVMRTVRDRLLTPMGLRSLAPGEPGYHARYEGGVYERDSAYHQGTVWPWLMGPFLTAWIKVHEGSAQSRREAESWLSALAGHLDVAGLGQISEIADAESPHAPRGCIAQAWSVAELLRALVEDVHGRKPGPQVSPSAVAEAWP